METTRADALGARRCALRGLRDRVGCSVHASVFTRAAPERQAEALESPAEPPERWSLEATERGVETPLPVMQRLVLNPGREIARHVGTHVEELDRDPLCRLASELREQHIELGVLGVQRRDERAALEWPAVVLVLAREVDAARGEPLL